MPVRDRYRGVHGFPESVSSSWGAGQGAAYDGGLAGVTTFFQAGIPAADGVGLAGVPDDGLSGIFDDVKASEGVMGLWGLKANIFNDVAKSEGVMGLGALDAAIVNAADEFVGTVMEMGAWPASANEGGATGDLLNALTPDQKAAVSDLLSRGVQVIDAIRRVVYNTQQQAQASAVPATIAGFSTTTLALAAAAYFLTKRSRRRR